LREVIVVFPQKDIHIILGSSMFLFGATTSAGIIVEAENMDWDKFHRLVEDTVSRLRSADGHREKIESAIRRYLNQGYKYVLSPMVLWDYFTISSPGIPERAGYYGYEAEQVVAIFDQLAKEKWPD
jgi:hypothetical protein